MRNFITFIIALTLAYPAFGFDQFEEEAKFIYQRLTGKFLKQGGSTYNEMVALLKKGQKLQAAELATQEPSFIAATVRYWGAMMLSNDSDPLLLLNDGLAMVMGSVRDNQDARELLIGDYAYGRDPRLGAGRPRTDNNDIYLSLETQSKDISSLLYRYEPQWNIANALEASGILTTRWWASVNYSAGTNRRAIPAIFASFLCKSTPEAWKKHNLPTYRIRQDISRFPPGGAAVFQTECRTCHSIMDGLSGAFAKINFENDVIRWSSKVYPKYFHGEETYPEGYVTTDNSWINFLTESNNEVYGWPGQMTGSGILELGEMVANSKLYSECLVKRTFQTICRKEYNLNDAVIKTMAGSFRANGYKLKDLFTQVVSNENCK